MSTTWDPAAYLTFDDHRARPFHDLLARVTARSPRRVVDLGCGPGNLTTLLAARWPAAAVEALDSSAEMVEAARARGIDARRADVVGWTPAPDTDVVISNAVLQWVPQHRELLPRWIAALGPGAELAVQVPGNFGAPSHVLVRELAAERGLAAARRGCRRRAGGVRGAARRHRRRGRRLGDDLPAPAHGPGPGAGVDRRPRPCARCATPWTRAGTPAFRAELAPRLRAAYPAQPDGTTWFPFRRIFAVARVR